MTERFDIEPVSSYLRYLPAPLQEGHFIGRFLLAFEAILTGGVVAQADADETARSVRTGRRAENISANPPRGLGATLDGITKYFQPQQTPADFLPWLARWVAVDLREDWSEATRRRIVASIAPLYMLRGTCQGIEGAIRLCVSETVDVGIDDRVVNAETGQTYPHYFRIRLTVGTRQSPASIQQLYRKVEAVVDLQKPAHTYYSVVLQYPPLELLDEDPGKSPKSLATEGVYVGRNTMLGNRDVDMETGAPVSVRHAFSPDP